ncbi:hypothetical protein BH23BAC1_BH23BAC1_19520 [soil metagenome]
MLDDIYKALKDFADKNPYSIQKIQERRHIKKPESAYPVAVCRI